MAPSAGEKTEFDMGELNNIIGAGANAPIFMLILTQLERLTQVRGSRNTSVFKLNSQ